MTESQLQDAVIELARLLGYRVAHFRPAKTEQGWRTPVQGDGKGFPDLVLARPGRLIFLELKSKVGRLTVEQRAWLELLGAAGAEAFTACPDQWTSGSLEAFLRGDRVALASST